MRGYINILNAELAEELVHRGFESPDLDYKGSFDSSERAWFEITKDVIAMANNGGGYIVIGVEDGTFNPVGVGESFHKDSQEWVEKMSRWLTGNLAIEYLEHAITIKKQSKKFAILKIHGSIGALVIPKIDGYYNLPSGARNCAFRLGTIYTRRNSASVQATGDEFWQLFWALMKRTAAVLGGSGVPVEVLSALIKKSEPDHIEETLWFNLFPVIELPDYVYSAETKYREASEIFTKIEQEPISENTQINPPTFFLENKKIYSFSPFDELNPLSLCINSSPKAESTQLWIDDIAKHYKLVKLLNFNLKNLCRRRGFFYDQKRDRFFVRYSGGSIPEVTWKPYASTSTRQLVYPKLSKADGRLLYCEHFAGRLRFIILGKGIYLIIEPIRVLTVDGQRPLDQNINMRISTKKNFRYHNNNYLYDMKLWLHILAGNRQEIHLGQGLGKTTISILSINSKVDFGILDDQHTNEDFLDSLKSEPIDYDITTYAEDEEGNPLTETSLED